MRVRSVTTQAVMTSRMRRYVAARRIEPCRRAHDLVVGADFAPFADGLSSAVAQCRRCGAWFNHVFDALAAPRLPSDVLGPLPSTAPLVRPWRERRARMCRCAVTPFPPATSACPPGSFAVGLPPLPSGVESAVHAQLELVTQQRDAWRDAWIRDVDALEAQLEARRAGDAADPPADGMLTPRYRCAFEPPCVECQRRDAEAAAQGLLPFDLPIRVDPRQRPGTIRLTQNTPDQTGDTPE